MSPKTNSCLYLLVFLSFSFPLFSQATLEWAINAGGPQGGTKGSDIVTDAQGNVYCSGFYQSPVDFDPGPGVNTLQPNGGFCDGFLCKYDANGQLIWAKNFGGPNTDYIRNITLDNNGDILITGEFIDSADFDPGPGVFQLNAISYMDGFVCKIDGGNGNLIWAKHLGGQHIESPQAIVADNSNNVYIGGFFVNNIDCDPGSGSYLLTAPLYQQTPFIIKLNSNGDFVWAEKFETAGTAGAQVYSMAIDSNNDLYIGGNFGGVYDFNPAIGADTLISNGADAYICKLDSASNFIWVQQLGGPNSQHLVDIEIGPLGNIYIAGQFYDFFQVNPPSPVISLTEIGHQDMFVLKMDAAGNAIWGKNIGGNNPMNTTVYLEGLSVDAIGDVYTTGWFNATIDCDPGLGQYLLVSKNIYSYPSIFISKLTTNGDFAAAWQMTESLVDVRAGDIAVDQNFNIYSTGFISKLIDFDPNDYSNYYINSFSPNLADVYIQKLSQRGVFGKIYSDFNQNCNSDPSEAGIGGLQLIIQPGGIVVTSSISGNWHTDALLAGNYTITLDTNSNWNPHCTFQQNFSIINPDSIHKGPDFGLLSNAPCAKPELSIDMPFMRPGFSNQYVYVQLCNEMDATDYLEDGFIILELDSLITVNSASVSYIDLGNNQFQILTDSLAPNECFNFHLSTTLSNQAILGQTLCLEANLFAAVDCSLDDIPNPFPTGTVSPCNTAWDHSSLMVEANCEIDSIRFTIYNTGDPITGDMTCYAPVRIYIDGQYVRLDSILLTGGDSAVFVLPATGQTWRLEVDQHPLHPGNSNPNATVELCGNSSNWTAGLVNILPMDDSDPIRDIFCGAVRGSYDPNDKTGYPLGIGTDHIVAPNQEIEYRIQFQNTGTDTAFNVIIRDTLPDEFDVFSVRPGASSHPYHFKVHGPKVLEWYFYDIMLPDSTTSEAASKGFVKFKVKQNPDLPIGTMLKNSAAIYFDYNAPIITNTYQHLIDTPRLNILFTDVNANLQNKELDIQVFPNPATDYTNIKINGASQTTEFRLNVYNLMGQSVVENLKSKNNQFTLDTQTFQNGVYLFQVKWREESIGTGKLIIHQ